MGASSDCTLPVFMHFLTILKLEGDAPAISEVKVIFKELSAKIIEQIAFFTPDQRRRKVY